MRKSSAIVECAGYHFSEVKLAPILVVRLLAYPQGCINTDQVAESAKAFVASD